MAASVEIDLDAVALGQGRERRELFLVGHVVDAPGGVFLAIAKAFSHRLVGCQHEFLDHGVGVAFTGVAPRAPHVAHQARVVVVELDHGLRQIQVHGAAFLPAQAQLAGERIHRAQRGQEGLVVLALAAHVAGQGSGNAGIVEATVRVNDCGTEVRLDDSQVAVVVDARHHRQAIFARQQRTQIPGQNLGQHGNRAIGQIHAHAARLGFVVEGGAFAQVVRDVGDRDPQPVPAARQGLQGHRVVEVARGFGIDGREGNRAQIRSVAKVRGLDRTWRELRLAHDGGGKFLADVGTRQGLLDLGARVIGIAQDLEQGNLDGRIGRVGIADNLGHHGLAGTRADTAAHDHRRADAWVVGLEAKLVAMSFKLARYFPASALENLVDPALQAAAAHPPLDFDAIAVHGRAAVTRADVDVFGMIVRNHEAVAVGVDLDPARHDARRATVKRCVHGCRAAYTGTRVSAWGRENRLDSRRSLLRRGGLVRVRRGQLEDGTQLGCFQRGRQLNVWPNLLGLGESLQSHRLIVKASPVHRAQMQIGARSELVFAQSRLPGFLQSRSQELQRCVEIRRRVLLQRFPVKIDDLLPHILALLACRPRRAGRHRAHAHAQHEREGAKRMEPSQR